ncbi:hypothetical protein BW685_05485 [Burkholderia ubonensis]|uniref:Protein L n=1 Tax=Burkholderia ubonensis TaxID=101571 RepID=A0A1R1JGW3_9BURK|nr:hypothetical protein BW685_05485 [Burkholderia ubonensis]
MAFYQDAAYLTHENRPEYNTTHGPAQVVPVSGVYRCDGCGASIVSTMNHRFPPQNHHQHTTEQGHIRWRLVVRTTHIS